MISNVSGTEFVEGETVTFTSRVRFHTELWAPVTSWSWNNGQAVDNVINTTSTSEAVYTATVTMVPEYNGLSLRAETRFGGPPVDSYPADWSAFSTTVPSYNYEDTTAPFSVLCKYVPTAYSTWGFWRQRMQIKTVKP